MKKPLWITGLIMLAMLTVMACATIETATTLATAVGEQAGVISHSQAESVRKSTVAVSRSLEDFTPEQEYYIGRTVGAVVLSKYPAYANTQVNQYINTLGQTLAAASNKPEIFGGYHFVVLDSDDINAFATPSGLIFVTRGLIRCCPTEDALAAILAHEIGHVQQRHGMQSIEKARVTEALTVLAQEGAKTLGSREVAQLTETFSGAISDIANSMINNGYSRTFEYQADQASVALVQRVGYNHEGLIDMLTVMEKKLKPGGLDFAKTHPAPRDRITEIQSYNQTLPPVAMPKIRQERFLRVIGPI
ncbi:MAG: M48 family metalloprotease [Deltaproteobacteria bacterium]|nr:M48 family metalloprotease [Deltaproteobacteria bacterium]